MSAVVYLQNQRVFHFGFSKLASLESGASKLDCHRNAATHAVGGATEHVVPGKGGPARPGQLHGRGGRASCEQGSGRTGHQAVQ